MAGYNQQGPMNEGPMTGRGRGLCGDNVQPDQGFGGQMMGRGRGGGGGRGVCQARGRGIGAGRQYSQVPQQSSPAESALQNRVNTLEAELLELKNQLINNQ